MLVLLPIILLVVFALLLFAIILLFFQIFDVFLDLPYVATERKKIETIIKLAKIKKGETVVDLGSGDGRLLFAAAQRGAYAIGYEINPFLVWLTRLRARFLGYSSSESAVAFKNSVRGPTSKKNQRPKRSDLQKGSVIIKKQNLWKADLAVADVIFVYSLKTHIQKFEDFVYKNAKVGTRIVVNTNPFPNKKPLKIENGIFLYKV